MVFLGNILVSQVVKKRLFGKPFVPLSNFCAVLSFLYESGAILGRARRNKVDTLEKVLVSSVDIHEITRGYCLYLTKLPPQRETEQIEFLRRLARNRLDKFRNDTGKEPDTFFEFILLRELEWRTKGVPDSLKDYLREKPKAQNKISLQEAYYDIQGFGLEGIGFGSSFPELTERMYKSAYEGIDTDLWSEARAHGLAIPERPTIVSFEEREETVLQMVAAYVAEYYPELLESLDLQLT
jgi:hypothetical protein